MYSFCTLFDSKYIDKGLALYDSLCDVIDDFCLYIFAFDDICYQVLDDMNLTKAVIIRLNQFETKQMLEIKKERSRAEYCWTCTPISIEYVFETYSVSMCTYLDADLYFFGSPIKLLDEIKGTGNAIMITEHRFPQNKQGDLAIEKYGKYCVQFNTFVNNERGRKVLSWWKDRCIEWCYFRKEENRMGDQKYLDNWTRDFEGVHELQHLGGGVAPWNLEQYTLEQGKSTMITIRNHSDNKQYELIFYHFQNLRYLPFRLVNIKAGKARKELKTTIYNPYLYKIECIRKRLKKDYGLTFETSKSCSSNVIVEFIQKYIMQFKVTSSSDILSLNYIMDYYERR